MQKYSFTLVNLSHLWTTDMRTNVFATGQQQGNGFFAKLSCVGNTGSSLELDAFLKLE